MELNDFRDPALARELIEAIAQLGEGRSVNLMEVCGTHTVSLSLIHISWATAWCSFMSNS